MDNNENKAKHNHFQHFNGKTKETFKKIFFPSFFDLKKKEKLEQANYKFIFFNENVVV